MRAPAHMSVSACVCLCVYMRVCLCVQMGMWSDRMDRIRTAAHHTVDGQRKQFKLKSTRALEKQPEFLANGGV